MRLALAVLAAFGFTFCFGYPAGEDFKKYENIWDELSDYVNPDLEDRLKYASLVDKDEWSLVPLINGSFRLVNVKEAEEEYKNMPQPRSDMIVTFQLHTRKNLKVPQFISVHNENSLKNSNYDSRKPTKFITHGWLNQASSKVNVILRKGILDNCDCNVFVVDWSAGANTFNYVAARYKVPDTGSQLADFLDFLNLSGEMKFKDLTLIGHSLGAHASGLAAKKVKRGKVNIVIGLDPASPLFSYKQPDDRLAPEDAEYVQTIHTSGGSLSFLEPLGQASFYPNWGEVQPGCGIDAFSRCAHRRSYEYYGESFYPNNSFVPFDCLDYMGLLERSCTILQSTIRMGGEPAQQKYPKGIFYVPTHSESPFAMGEVESNIVV